MPEYAIEPNFLSDSLAECLSLRFVDESSQWTRTHIHFYVLCIGIGRRKRDQKGRPPPTPLCVDPEG